MPAASESRKARAYRVQGRQSTVSASKYRATGMVTLIVCAICKPSRSSTVCITRSGNPSTTAVDVRFRSTISLAHSHTPWTRQSWISIRFTLSFHGRVARLHAVIPNANTLTAQEDLKAPTAPRSYGFSICGDHRREESVSCHQTPMSS